MIPAARLSRSWAALIGSLDLVSTASPSSRVARVRTWLLSRDHLCTVIMLAVFAALILTGTTTSNLGTEGMRQDPGASHVIQLGHSQGIRSDEYWVSSPTALSIMETGAQPTYSPLGEDAGFVLRYTDGGIASTIVFYQSDILLAEFLPENILFAAFWWLPVIALFLGLPRWFGHVSGSRRYGWLAALLIAFSPSSAWWSQVPITSMSFAVLGCALLISVHKRVVARRWVTAVLLGAVSAVLLTAIPTIYAPWSIVLGLPLLVATVVWIFTRTATTWWERIGPVAAVGFVALVLSGLTFLENAAGLQSLASTLYPGERRSPAESMSVARLLGAPALGALRTDAPITSNASSITSSFTVTFLIAAVLVVGRLSFGGWRRNPVLVVLGAFAAAFLLWCTAALGDASRIVPLLNLVPANRVAGVIGILGIVILCLMLAGATERPTRRLAIAAAMVAGVATLYGTSQVKVEFLPGLSAVVILGSSVVVAAVAYVLVRHPRNVGAIAVAAIAASLTVVGANPLLVGLGDLRASDTGKALISAGTEVRADGQLWASDSVWFDSAMLASGVPSLSGVQRIGPDADQWARLDPTGEYEDAWNRGGSFIFFHWTPGEALVIDSPQSDIIDVSIDPCELIARFPEVSTIASGAPLSSTCLVEEETLEWLGEPVYTYGTR